MTGQVRILVVEDRADWQTIICDAIADNGYLSHPVSNYEDAIEALNTHQFSMAIIDPVLDLVNPFNRVGVSIIQKIREMNPTLPIIVVTGSFTPDIRISLDKISPETTVVYKETWDPSEFAALLAQRLDPADNRPADTVTSEDDLMVETDSDSTALHNEHHFGRARVLIVENRPDWQTIIGDILDAEGCYWRIAADAQAALAELERENFHLVLLDLKLQSNDLPINSSEGWLLLDHLVETFPKTRVVIISGQATPSDVAQLLTQYPILGFIEKQRFSRHQIIDAVAQATQAPELRIQTLGPFRLWCDGRAITNWERPQSETLTKILLARRAGGERVITIDELIMRLWPDSDDVSGRKKLLPLISTARRILEPDIEPRDSHFIARTGNGYFFDLSGQVKWDLIDFRAHWGAGYRLLREEQWADAIAEFEKGVALYQGDFLAEDRYAQWALRLRHEIVNEYRDLQIALADSYAALSKYPQAIAACEAALRKDPVMESVYRRLMRFHYCNDEKGLALKVYRDCLKIFEEMFEESPTPATRRLYEAIANDEPVDCLAER